MDVVHLPPEVDGAERAFTALRTLLERDGDEIAAMVVEPLVQGASGMRMYDAELLREARALTRKHGVLLVFDEVFTGYGRTGSMWAADRAGVSPDMLCTAKGFTAGILPMAATLVTDELFRGFLGDPERAFYYGHTYCGHALGAAVAREVLKVFRDEEIIAGSRAKAQKITQMFERLGKLPGVHQARSLGMIGALDLGGAEALDVERDGGYLDESGWRVYEEALARGAYLRPLGNVVYTCPPLNIPDADLDELLAVIEASVNAVLAT
jgi:adenosylmethionine---8-amino-7-oxononanoate aminotransferase